MCHVYLEKVPRGRASLRTKAVGRERVVRGWGEGVVVLFLIFFPFFPQIAVLCLSGEAALAPKCLALPLPVGSSLGLGKARAAHAAILTLGSGLGPCSTSGKGEGHEEGGGWCCWTPGLACSRGSDLCSCSAHRLCLPFAESPECVLKPDFTLV